MARGGNLPDRRAALTRAAVLLVPYLALCRITVGIPTGVGRAALPDHMQSLVFDRDLDLTNNYASQAYREFYPDQLTDIHAIQVGAVAVPIRDLGLPLIGSIPFALGGRAGVLALMALVARRRSRRSLPRVPRAAHRARPALSARFLVP